MADLHFICPHCYGTLVVDDDGAGWEVDCPLCANPLIIPDADQSEEGVEYVETATQEYYIDSAAGPGYERAAPVEEAPAYYAAGDAAAAVSDYDEAPNQVPPGYEVRMTPSGVPYLVPTEAPVPEWGAYGEVSHEQELEEVEAAEDEVVAEDSPPRSMVLPPPRETGKAPFRAVRGQGDGEVDQTAEASDEEVPAAGLNGMGGLRAKWELYRCPECVGVFRLKRSERGAVVACPQCESRLETAKPGTKALPMPPDEGGAGGDRVPGKGRDAGVDGGGGKLPAPGSSRGIGERRERLGEEEEFAGENEETTGGGRIPFQRSKVQRVDLKFKVPEEVSSRKLREKAGDGTLAKAESQYRERKELPWDSELAGAKVEGGPGGTTGRGLAYAAMGALALLCAGIVWMVMVSTSDKEAAGEGASWSYTGEGEGTVSGAAGNPSAAGKDQKFYAFVNETKGEAIGVLEKFLKAPTYDERLKYVWNPERVRVLAGESARYRSDEPFGYREINDTTLSVVKGRPTILVDVELHDYTTKRVAMHYGPEGYRVDWEWFVEFSDTSWVDFTTRKPSEPLTFRVHASRENYFNYQFDDPERWDCYKLESGDSEYRFYGYIDKSNPAAARLREALVKMPGVLGSPDTVYSSIRCVLKLRYPAVDGQVNMVEITDFVSEDWYGPEG